MSGHESAPPPDPSTWFDALVDRLLPAGLHPDEVGPARLFVTGWLPVFPFCVIAASWFAFTRSWGMVATLGLGFALGVTVLSVFRRTRRLGPPTHASLIVGSILFAGSALTQTPADPTAPTVLVVIPIAAAFVLGPRAAWAYLAFCTVVVITTLVLVAQGVALPYRDEEPVVTQALNFVYAMTVVLVFSRSADQMRAKVIEEQRAAATTKSRFLANISHEIRTPMHGVLGMTEELLTSPELPAEAKERLSVIQRSGQQMVTLINDLLDLSRMEAGKLAIAPGPADLVQLVDDVRALFEPLAVKKGLRFAVQVAPGTPRWITIDGARLKQVLTNLVSNAVKFTDAGSITVGVRPGSSASALTFSVSDTGVGIEASVIPRLFAAFEQGDPSPSRRHDGSGLGLALSKQLTALLGGALTVASKPGEGSTFSFELPVTPGEPAPARAEVYPPASERLTVLVVDDNPINRRVAEGLLSRAGHSVRSVANGQEALDAIVAGPVDAVLMDCHMPVMDGFEAAERIRLLDSPRSATPIIAITASASVEDLEACQRAGMNAWLAKPVSYAELMQALERVTRPG